MKIVILALITAALTLMASDAFAAKKKKNDGALPNLTHAQALDACRKEYPQASDWNVTLDSKGVWQCEASQ